MLTSECVMGTSMIVSTGAVSYNPASIMNLIWFANVYSVGTKQHGNIKSSVL